MTIYGLFFSKQSIFLYRYNIVDKLLNVGFALDPSNSVIKRLLCTIVTHPAVLYISTGSKTDLFKIKDKYGK